MGSAKNHDIHKRSLDHNSLKRTESSMSTTGFHEDPYSRDDRSNYPIPYPRVGKRDTRRTSFPIPYPRIGKRNRMKLVDFLTKSLDNRKQYRIATPDDDEEWSKHGHLEIGSYLEPATANWEQNLEPIMFPRPRIRSYTGKGSVAELMVKPRSQKWRDLVKILNSRD